MPRSTQQDPPSPHPRKVPTSGFPFLRWVLSAVPPKVSGLCLVLPSTLSVAVLPPGQVWGRGRSGPSMPFHGGSIMHPLTSILSHRPGGLTGGDSAPETSVVPRTWNYAARKPGNESQVCPRLQNGLYVLLFFLLAVPYSLIITIV